MATVGVKGLMDILLGICTVASVPYKHVRSGKSARLFLTVTIIRESAITLSMNLAFCV